MISIIEEQENGFPDKACSIANESEKVESELKYVSRALLQSSKSILSEHNIEDIDMLDVLNRVSVRIDELQSENQSLKKCVSSEQE
jgi:hypothetical protein